MSTLPGSQHSDDPAWRDRLLASLRDCGVQQTRRNWILQWFITLLVAAAIAIVTLVGRLILSEALRNQSDAPLRAAVALAWGAFVTLVLLRVRNSFILRAWKASARSAEQELQRGGFRRPILYLRSFQLDERINRTTWLDVLLGRAKTANSEQEMVKALRKLGPVIAIGKPDEKLPKLGAARFYASDDRWQEKVADVAREAQLIVWASGHTEGLRWEVKHLIGNVPPERLLVVAHPHLLNTSRQAREQEWQQFLSTLGQEFPRPLPASLGEARFFYFTKDWEPRAIAAPRKLIPWGGATAAAARQLVRVKQGKVAEATAVYPGPSENDDLGGILGASSPDIQWGRVAGFAAACILLKFSLRGPFSCGANPLLWGLVVTAAAVLAFRYLRDSLAPLSAAAGGTVVLAVLGSQYLNWQWQLEMFSCLFVLLSVLSWSTRRMGPRPVAFWVSAMAMALCSRMFTVALAGDYPVYDTVTQRVLTYIGLLLGPIAFAICLELVARLLPGSATTPHPQTNPTG